MKFRIPSITNSVNDGATKWRGTYHAGCHEFFLLSLSNSEETVIISWRCFCYAVITLTVCSSKIVAPILLFIVLRERQSRSNTLYMSPVQHSAYCADAASSRELCQRTLGT